MDEKPDLLLTLEMAGIILPKNTGRPFFVLCPFHDDRKNPNMRVDPNQGVFYCHACGSGGDAISFIGLQLYGGSFNNRNPEMFSAVMDQIKTNEIPRVEYRPPRRPKELSQEIVQVLTLAARVYHLALMGKGGIKAQTYLKARHIDVSAMRRYRLGYAAPGALIGALAGYPPSLRNAAQEAGLYIEDSRGKMRELLQRRVIFPDLMRNGSVCHMVGRSLDPNTKISYKYFSLSGMPKTIWGLARASKREPVILTESTPDAVSLLQMGIQGTAVGGTGIASYLVKELKKISVLIFLPQNDERGREAVLQWKELLPHARVLDDYPYSDDEKDINDQVLNLGLPETAKNLRQSLATIGVHIQIVNS